MVNGEGVEVMFACEKTGFPVLKPNDCVAGEQVKSWISACAHAEPFKGLTQLEESRT